MGGGLWQCIFFCSSGHFRAFFFLLVHIDSVKLINTKKKKENNTTVHKMWIIIIGLFKPSLTGYLSTIYFLKISSSTFTPKPYKLRGWHFDVILLPPPRSYVTCHRVHFLGGGAQSVEPSRWRVCHQRGRKKHWIKFYPFIQIVSSSRLLNVFCYPNDFYLFWS